VEGGSAGCVTHCATMTLSELRALLYELFCSMLMTCVAMAAAVKLSSTTTLKRKRSAQTACSPWDQSLFSQCEKIKCRFTVASLQSIRQRTSQCSPFNNTSGTCPARFPTWRRRCSISSQCWPTCCLHATSARCPRGAIYRPSCLRTVIGTLVRPSCAPLPPLWLMSHCQT
jgi:hypothetical protein